MTWNDHSAAQPQENPPPAAPEDTRGASGIHGPGWDSTLIRRQVGLDPNFIGHDETIEAFNARRHAHLAELAAQADQDVLAQTPASNAPTSW